MSKEGFQEEFGYHLRQFREKRDISIRDLELSGNVDRHMLSKIENGKKNPTIYTIKQIVESMDSNLSEFFKDFNTDNGAKRREMPKMRWNW